MTMTAVEGALDAECEFYGSGTDGVAGNLVGSERESADGRGGADADWVERSLAGAVPEGGRNPGRAVTFTVLVGSGDLQRMQYLGLHGDNEWIGTANDFGDANRCGAGDDSKPRTAM